METLRDSVKSESEEAGKHYRKLWDEVKEANFRDRMESFLKDLISFSHSPPPHLTQKPMFGFMRRMVAVEKKTMSRSFRLYERAIEEVVKKEGEADATIHRLGKESEITPVMEEEHTIGEKLLEAEKRLGDFLDRVREVKEQEVGHGRELGENENPGPYFSNPKNPYLVDKRPEVVEETSEPHMAEGGEGIITENDLEMAPFPLNDCTKRIDLEDTFALNDGDLEEDRAGKTAQDDVYWDLMVRR